MPILFQRKRDEDKEKDEEESNVWKKNSLWTDEAITCAHVAHRFCQVCVNKLFSSHVTPNMPTKSKYRTPYTIHLRWSNTSPISRRMTRVFSFWSVSPSRSHSKFINMVDEIQRNTYARQSFAFMNCRQTQMVSNEVWKFFCGLVHYFVCEYPVFKYSDNKVWQSLSLWQFRLNRYIHPIWPVAVFIDN